MQAKCSLCDQIDYIDDKTYRAKRLKNSRILSYLCKECHERITKRTKARLETGKFHLNNGVSKVEDDNSSNLDDFF